MSTARGGKDKAFPFYARGKGYRRRSVPNPYTARWEHGRIPMFLSPPRGEALFGHFCKKANAERFGAPRFFVHIILFLQRREKEHRT